MTVVRPSVSSDSDSDSPKKPTPNTAFTKQRNKQTNTHTETDKPTCDTSSPDALQVPSPESSSSSEIPLTTVSTHLGGSDPGRAWTVIHGHVYDITEFSSQHPGGSIIRLAAGRDSTSLVESYHPKSSLRKIEHALKNKTTYVGRVATPRYDDSFFRTVRNRVDTYLAANHLQHHYYEWVSMTEVLLTLGLYLYASYAVITTGSYAWAAALGVLTGRMGFLMHTGNHQGISKHLATNRFVGYFMDLIGSSNVIWGFEHQVAHHMDPNELGRDNDCEIGNPWIRMHPGLPHAWYHRFQPITIVLGMSIGFIKWYLSDIPHFFAGTVGNVKFAVTKRDYAIIFAFKAAWFVLHIALPVYMHGPARAAGLSMVFLVIGAHYLENIFIVNHIQGHLIPPSDIHWAPKQVLSTANWGSGSVFWNWFSGGLNHQIEHHLFPATSTYLYPHISHIVRETCEEYGLPYSNYSTFVHAWADMISHMYKLGNPSPQELQQQSQTQAKKQH